MIRGQYMLKPDPTNGKLKNQCHQYFPNERDPVEIKWDKSIFKEAKANKLKWHSESADPAKALSDQSTKV